MNISRINSNFNFNATPIGKLKEEMGSKQIDKKTTDEIKELVPDAKVDINKDNKNSYYISLFGNEFFAERGDDENSLDYPSLIKALTHIKENYRF